MPRNCGRLYNLAGFPRLYYHSRDRKEVLQERVSLVYEEFLLFILVEKFFNTSFCCHIIRNRNIISYIKSELPLCTKNMMKTGDRPHWLYHGIAHCALVHFVLCSMKFKHWTQMIEAKIYLLNCSGQNLARVYSQITFKVGSWMVRGNIIQNSLRVKSIKCSNASFLYDPNINLSLSTTCNMLQESCVLFDWIVYTFSLHV